MLNKNETLTLVKKVLTQYNNTITSKISSHNHNTSYAPLSHTSDTTSHITASERTSWNSKSNFSGSYTDLTNKPSVFTPATHTHIKSNITDFAHTHTTTDLPTGTTSTTVALGNHTHSGTYEPVITKNTAFNVNFDTTATNIKMNGTQSLGSLSTVARADHVHPADTSRVPTSRTINSKSLSSNITLTLDDVANGTTRSLSNYSLTSHNHYDNMVETPIYNSMLALSTDKYQKTTMVTGTTILFPYVLGFTEIHLFFYANANMELFFPYCEWQSVPNITNGKYYELVFTCIDSDNDVWLGKCISYRSPSLYNKFVFDYSNSYSTFNIVLQNNRGEDTTPWDGLTDWGDGTIDTNLTHTYSKTGIYTVKTKYLISTSTGSQDSDTARKLIGCKALNEKMKNVSYLFSNCQSLTSLDMSSFDTSNFTNMKKMFYSCVFLTSLNLSNLDTSNVTDMSSMFSSCIRLTSLDASSLNTSNVTTMYEMFYNCSKLTSLNISTFNTSNVKDMSYMFKYASSITSFNVSSFNTSNVEDMFSMFDSCSNLISLDLSNFNTPKLKRMTYMLSSCSKLTSVNLSNFDTSNTVYMGSVFSYCSNLISLDLSNFNTSNTTNMDYMFSSCSKLASLKISNFNLSKATSYSSMFSYCTALTRKNIILTNVSNTDITKLEAAGMPAKIVCTSLTLSPTSMIAIFTDTRNITATILPVNTTDELIWSTNSTSCIVNNGIVTFSATGNYIVTATCGSKIATCNIQATLSTTDA